MSSAFAVATALASGDGPFLRSLELVPEAEEAEEAVAAYMTRFHRARG